MINLYKQDGETLYGIKEFILDTEEDVKKLQTNIRIGSSALVISTGNVYFLNGSKKWTLLGEDTLSNETEGDNNPNVLNQFDTDSDGIIDQAETAFAIELGSF